MKYDIDVLQVKSFSDTIYQVVGIMSSNSFLICDQQDVVRASRVSLELVRAALAAGKKVFVPKLLAYSEVVPSEVVVKDNDSLNAVKATAKHYVINLMNTNVTRVNILNVIDYMQCYMKLMNAGICITDDNREDKYFEIIEAAQSIEEPQQIDENASFEQQYEYSVAKQKYDNAQDNLKTLEMYLNSYDQLSKINFVHKLLHRMLDEIDAADSVDSVDKSVKTALDTVNEYFYCEK